MSVGPVQIIFILLVVLIIFGAGKLPRVMGDVGKGIKSFKKGISDKDDDNDSKNQNDQQIKAEQKDDSSDVDKKS
jgi:sec-independent protein translocase protein TatA